MASWFYVTILGLLITLVAAATVRTGLLLRRWTPPFNPLLTWPDNILRLALIALAGLIGITLGPGPLALGWSLDGLPANLALGVASGLLMSVFMSLVGWLVMRHWGEAVYSEKILQSIIPVNGREWRGVLLALLPAALLEEMLFRSLPLGGLGWLVSPWLLLWPLALLFGLLHWPQGWWGVAGTTLAGILLSFVFLSSGSLWAVWMAHYVMNVSQIGFAVLAGVHPVRA